MKKNTSATSTSTTKPAKSFAETGVPLNPSVLPTSAQAASPNLRRPAHTLRMGPLQASIWENQTQQGKMYSVTFDRSYKDGENWKRSASFGRGNLLMVARLAEQAFDWIAAQSAQQPKAVAA